MAFALGRQSRTNLIGVHNSLLLVCENAIARSHVDFTVGEGVRTQARQKLLVDSGASKTMDSKHLTGDAVDLWALVRGKVAWDWPLYFVIAEAMKGACSELNVPLVWGGVWDRKLSILSGDLEEEVAEYVLRRKALGKTAFLDGPHFQLE